MKVPFTITAPLLLLLSEAVGATFLNSPYFNAPLSGLLSSTKQAVFSSKHHGMHVNTKPDPARVSENQWMYTTVLPALPHYQLRVKQPKLCDPSVKQLSGYLDVNSDKHFFFWFFEARNGRKDAPLILWVNGGPGCSSSTGLLAELGPCRVEPGGNSTKLNPYSWNNEAHVIFLDQPLNVGFSYGNNVFNSIDAGKDVNAFLQLFLETFPEYENSPLHVFGESYGGHYVPAIAKAIYEFNKDLASKDSLGLLSVAEKSLRTLPLTTIGIGNGLVDPLIQYKYYGKMACNSTYSPVLSQDQCNAMDSLYPTCARLINACYKFKNQLACVPPEYYCNRMLMSYSMSGQNPYDVRIPCGNSDLCYPIFDDIATYLNNPEIQKELGSEVSEFVSCSQKVYSGFILNGDWMMPYFEFVPTLLDNNIPVLVYAGDADWICNWYGNKAWTLELPWSGQEAFNQANDRVWTNTQTGKEAGEVRNHGPFTFLRIFSAGHMVPLDQPENALDMINRWIKGQPLIA
ncbi:hypothetical protein EV182_004537 [Spiromyces aspiralis]|uniref:Uncharacterized protein n=1 Tax=Spiromyces aspiralis TaxID=68401 RepID=A0ACC1HEY3_9FUNG|nr:hypothetical protein EV182_004537 [Spiromyces aspiralis]